MERVSSYIMQKIKSKNNVITSKNCLLLVRLFAILLVREQTIHIFIPSVGWYADKVRLKNGKYFTTVITKCA